MPDPRTIFSYLKRVLVVLTIGFSIMVVVAVTQYAIGNDISDVVKRTIIFLLVSALLTSLHFWINNLKRSTGSALFNFVTIVFIAQYAASLVFVGLLAFSIGDTMTNLLFIGAFQLIHLAIYTLDWFLQEEGPAQSHPNLSVEQIAAINEQNRNRLAPRYQDSTQDC